MYSLFFFSIHGPSKILGKLFFLEEGSIASTIFSKRFPNWELLVCKVNTKFVLVLGSVLFFFFILWILKAFRT